MRLYGGIKRGYPLVSRYAESIAIFAQLVRPYTLVAPLIAGILGGLLPIVYVTRAYPTGFVLSNWFTFLLLVLVLMCVQAGGQVINQVADVEIDRINKPYRPLPQGKISLRTAFIIGVLLEVICLISAFLINIIVFTLSTIGVWLSIFYSLEPIRAKKRGWLLAIMWQAVARGFLPFLITWSVFGDIHEPLPWLLGIVGFLWVLAFQGTKDFADYEGDLKFNISTIVTTFGFIKATRIILWLGILPVWVSGLLVLLDRRFIFVPAFLAFMYLVTSVSLAKNVTIEEFENNMAWLLFYLGLGLLYVITFLSLIV